MQAYQENISAKVSGVLSPVLGVKVTVVDTATGNPATLYSDNGVTGIQQPLVTDETGYFGFYAANGHYKVSFSSAQITLAPRVVQLYDPADDAPLTQSQAAAASGSSRIGYQPAGGVSRSIENKLFETISIHDYGGRDDFSNAGGTDNAVALAKVTAAFPNGCIIRFPKTNTGMYDFKSYGAGNLNLYTYDVEDGVTLRFPVNAMMGQSFSKWTRDTVCYFKDLNTRYTMKSSFPSTGQARFHLNKTQYMGPGDRDTTVASVVDLTAASIEKFDCAWPDGPLTVSSSITTTNKKASIALAAGNNGIKGIALPAFPGAEYSCTFETPAGWDGFYILGALTQNGFDVMYEATAPGTGASRMVKEFGSPAVNSAVKFRGSGNTASTWVKNSYCTVRCLTSNSFEVLVNGVRRYRAWSTNSALRSVFIGAGFGSAAATIGVRDVLLSRSKLTAGQKPLKIMSVGDSITDGQIHGNWPNFMAQALEGTMGIRVSRLVNIAVSGAKTSDQYASLLTADISDIDVAVILIGVNDIQAQTDVENDFIFNIGRILDRFNNAGIPCVVGIPTMFYSRALAAGITGFATQGVDALNYDRGGLYRGRLAYEVASRNPVMNRLCSSTLEDLGPVLADWLADAEGVDSIVVDNIHPTSHARRLIGYGIARSVAGLLAPHTSRAYPRTGIQPSWFLNSWSNTNGSASYEIDEAGTLGLRGLIDKGAGSIADGTDLFVLPPNLRPTTSITLPCIVTGAAFNAIARVLIDNNTGKATLFGAPTGTTGIYLDSIHYKLNW
jgi:lysophospholipase L1-like esterase